MDPYFNPTSSTPYHWKHNYTLDSSQFNEAAITFTYTDVHTFLIIPNREFTQHDAPADDEPKKSRNERVHAILSQVLARI